MLRLIAMMPRAVGNEAAAQNTGDGPLVRPHPAGAEAPLRQARAIGIATNFVLSSDFTRMTTACLSFF